ncbi:MAG: BlaI/MecI/CopY family transcriptional regulator [Flavipsychrobacter sp.]|nr:BlaI/MecI/CopY family transcriptional regulator [Flavipsychrobacter sp.]
MQPTIKATEAELEILNVLWAQGPATVKEVHEQLALTKDTGYTTTLKLMQNMLEKQLVSRDATSKKHVYQAIVNRELAQGQAVQQLIKTMFNGSAMQLVAQALGNHKPNKAELELIREYLDKKTNE